MTGNDLTLGRREFLGGLAALGAITTTACDPCCRAPISLPMPTGDFAIDAHCHVFNLSDLPAASFVERVTLDIEDNAQLWPLVPFIQMVATALVDRSPTAREELACLASAEPRRQTGDLRAKPRAFTADRTQDLHDAVEGVLRKHLESNPVLKAPGLHAESRWPRRDDCKPPDEQRLKATGKLHAEMATLPWLPKLAKRYLADPQYDDRAAFERSIPELTRNLIAGKPQGFHVMNNREGDPLSTLINWVWAMTDYRFRHVEDLVRLSAFGSRRLGLIVPAVVDYQVPLNAPPMATSLADQIAVMERIAEIRPAGCAVHGYAPFDPFRDIGLDGNAPGSSLALVKDAVERRGFIGVKLYPPMGFRAIGNADKDTSGYPSHLKDEKDLGGRLDRSLVGLYEWCCEKDVPILVHCSDSQEAADASGLKADPGYWKRVLEDQRFSKLRLNLGHFGSIWKDTCKPWVEALFPLLRYDNVYADVSDFSFVVRREGTDDAASDTQFWKELAWGLEKYPESRRKILYGSDWNMLGREPGDERFFGEIFKQLPGRTGIPEADIMCGNAVDFLGLRSSPKVRERLGTWYDARGLTPTLLRAVDSLPKRRA